MDGINIWSGSNDPLGAALTNPTEISVRKGRLTDHVRVIVDGTEYLSAEQAYFAKRDESRDVETMINVIAEKFNQHPELSEQVKDNGGVEWLKTCEHFTNARTEGFQWWEGVGVHSPFIYALVQGYELHLSGWSWPITPEPPIQTKLTDRNS